MISNEHDGKNPQISTTVSWGLYQEIDEMAKKNDRTLSNMAAILLERAVKESKRKRTNAKENNT